MSVEGTIPGERVEDSGAGAVAASGGRSTAMWLMPIAALVEALITVLVMSSIGFIPPLVVFLVILVALAVVGFARPRPRVFVTGGILLAVFIAMNAPFAIDGLIHPIGSSHAWTDIVAIVVGIAGAIAGFAAFVELRRGQPVVRRCLIVSVCPTLCQLELRALNVGDALRPLPRRYCTRCQLRRT